MSDSSEQRQTPPCPEVPLPTRIEVLLLSTERPLAEARLAGLLGLDESSAANAIRKAIDELNADYEKTGRGFRAQRVAGGWQLLTLPALGELVSRLHQDRRESRQPSRAWSP